MFRKFRTHRKATALALSIPLSVAALVSSSASAQIAPGQGIVTNAVITGTIDDLQIYNPTDVWSGGQMVVAGQTVIIPRNMVIELPANRMSLQQLHAQAPPEALALGNTGLATNDGLGSAAIATVHGNRSAFGNVIAGFIFIEKGQEVSSGVVSYINHTDGYLRIDGLLGDPTTGTMIRINDPSGRFTIQQGLGCAGTPNCSADERFGVDPDNYTITFSTGYPAGIPSTVPLSMRASVPAGMDPAAASDANGLGDPLCPDSNRGVLPVPDSTKFAPIQVGDHLVAEGNFENIGDNYFLSAHTVGVSAGLTTAQDPNQPDYMIFDEAEWDVPDFANQRLRILLIGFTTLSNSLVDIYSLPIDPTTGLEHERILGSTFGNPTTVNQGIPPTDGGVFKIRYDIDFIQGPTQRRNPCENLINAGWVPNPCPMGGTVAENLLITMPITRDLIAHTRHSLTLNPGVVTLDVNGNVSTNGGYLNPVGLGFPEFGEIDLGALETPLVFAGLPWNLDRRLGPGGSDGAFQATPQPISPFPASGLDLVGSLPSLPNQPFAFFPFGPADFLDPIALAPAPGMLPIGPVVLPAPPGAPAPQVMSITANLTGPFDLSADPILRTVTFTAQAVPSNAVSVGPATGFTWAFGDGQIGSGNPVMHTFTQAGTFTASVVAAGPGGTSALFTDDQSFEVTGAAPFDTPVAAFVPSATTGLAPLAVTFQDISDLASGPNSSITSRTWNWGDGTMPETYMAATNPSHIFELPSMQGQYTVQLTVVGPGGTDMTSLLITVDAPPAPLASLTALAGGAAPATGVQTLTVNFTDNSTGTISKRTLDFGDGTPAVTSMGAPASPLGMNHEYAAAGTFTATLMVENLGGSSTASQTIVVDPFLSEVRLQPRGATQGRIRTRNTNGIAVSSELDYGDGSPVNTQLPPFQELHQFPNVGFFVITLTTVDLFGNISVRTATANIN